MAEQLGIRETTAKEVFQFFVYEQTGEFARIGKTAEHASGTFNPFISASYGAGGTLLGAELNTTDNKKGFGFNNSYDPPTISFGPKPLTPGKVEQHSIVEVRKRMEAASEKAKSEKAKAERE